MSKKYTIAEVDKMANEFGHTMYCKAGGGRPTLWCSSIWLNASVDDDDDPVYLSDGDYWHSDIMTAEEVIKYYEENTDE